ncbi:hypothetical protein A2818_01910 [Candidatus Nomurabacteria bacterium RIFCSPHIGHO2_01_FULL_40_12]|uniref:FCP1 homology domain-containing protein n=1 Tax=Candidatus Nomurabacteria bacterium RIFCSPHIGHO2_01_FULL_40_12 TaxID=1801737 RepID=A0A1F6V1C4_9BACT|nr:MAG: hypothetical protein A2818_01910 [Candidatus Nomurabacteria bacterium RIFCSPHIGHO2_01_FULL_40_12]
MKYIFDFDDVLFNTTQHFKEQMCLILEKNGISRILIEEYTKKERWNLFTLKKMFVHFSVKEDVYEEIMKESKNSINQELLKLIKKLGKLNCYLVSYGDEEFQLEKIKRSEVGTLFSEIIIVQGSKKEAIEKICTKHKDEEVIFIDDKAKHFEDLDFVKYPNLKTILYTEQNIEPYLQ